MTLLQALVVTAVVAAIALATSVTYSTIYLRALRRNPMLFGPSIWNATNREWLWGLAIAVVMVVIGLAIS
jgi:hypothetical protein